MVSHPFNRKVGQQVKKHSLRNRWSKILQITTNPNSEGFEYYGGRGITMCREWSSKYNNFLLWAVQNGYREDLVLTRRDKSKNFEPSNCFFAENNKCTEPYISKK